MGVGKQTQPVEQGTSCAVGNESYLIYIFMAQQPGSFAPPLLALQPLKRKHKNHKLLDVLIRLLNYSQ